MPGPIEISGSSKKFLDTTKVTSKTTSLQELVIKAWKENWSDKQWGINIKTILPRGVSGDAYNLSDIILAQAFVGCSPNRKVLSYLDHSLSSQIISNAAVITRISKYQSFNKPICVKYLLEFLDKIFKGLTSRVKQEGQTLPAAIWRLVYWLLNCYQYYRETAVALADFEFDVNDLAQQAITLLDEILKNEFAFALLYYAKPKNLPTQQYAIISEKCQEIETLLLEKPMEADMRLNVPNILKKVSTMELNAAKKMKTPETYFVNYYIPSMMMIAFDENPTIDSNLLVNYLFAIQDLKNYSNSRMYMEVIRGCFVNLKNLQDGPNFTQWLAITYIKLPKMLQVMSSEYTRRDSTPEENSRNIVESFRLLCSNFAPLLNVIDSRNSIDSIESLVNELCTLAIISEEEKETISSYRAKCVLPESFRKKGEVTEPSIFQANVAMTKVVMSLETEHNEFKARVISSLLNGRRLDLILQVAAVTGRIPFFAEHLIKCNESNKRIIGLDAPSAAIKAQMFDISFLLLCFMAQKYGRKVIVSGLDSSSFFEKWAQECMLEKKKNKSNDILHKIQDDEKIEKLCAYFDGDEADQQEEQYVKNAPMNLDEMCMLMPAVIKRVFEGWKNATLSINDVKRKLRVISASSKLCCFTLCSFSWLCSHITILSESESLKPKNMLQQFFTLMDELQQDRLLSPNQEVSAEKNFEDRCILTTIIMRQIMYDMDPPVMITKGVSESIRNLLTKEEIMSKFPKFWEEIVSRGYLTIDSINFIRTAMDVGELTCLVELIVFHLMNLKSVEELNKALDMTCAIFSLNMQACAIALFTYLKQILHGEQIKYNCKLDLVEPYCTYLAKLTARVIYTSIQIRRAPKQSSENMEVDEPAYSSSDIGSRMHPNGDLSSYSMGTYEGRVELLNAWKNLFKSFNDVTAQTDVVTQDTYFVVAVLEQIVENCNDAAKFVVENMLGNLVPNLIETVPNLFRIELILQLYNLETPAGKQSALRDIILFRNNTMKMDQGENAPENNNFLLVPEFLKNNPENSNRF